MALAVRVGLAWLVPSIYRPDEVFQALEPAHRLVTGTGIVTWEWHEGTRSWLLPGLVAGLMRLAAWVGLHGAAGYLGLIAAALSLVSLGVVAVAVLLGWRHSGLVGATLCGVACALWPELVYFAPKTLTEAQGGNLLAIAAGLASLRPRDAPGGAGRRFCIGALLGLAFCVREQLAPALLLVALWSAPMRTPRSWLPLVLGGVLPLLVQGASDWSSWGMPFQSIWMNAVVNVVQGKAASYGVQPVWWYVSELVRLWGAAVGLVGVLFLLGAAEAPLLALVSLVVVLSHCLIAHKEISFIYAALPPALMVAGLGSARAVIWLGRALRPARPRGGLLLAAAAGLWAVTAAATADSGLRPLWFSISQHMMPVWRLAAREPDLCGLGLFGTDIWNKTGGYAFLNRPVPIYLVRSQAAAAEAQPGMNYLIAAEPPPPGLDAYATVLCADGYCLLRRGAACIPVERHRINDVLAHEGS